MPDPQPDPQPALLSDERLAEIAARADAASPGPWKSSSYGVEVLGPCPAGSGLPLLVCDTVRRTDTRQAPADAAFVAYAREDVPALLSHIAALRLLITDLLDPCGDGSEAALRLIERGKQEATARAVAVVRLLAADWRRALPQAEPGEQYRHFRGVIDALDAAADKIQRGED